VQLEAQQVNRIGKKHVLYAVDLAMWASLKQWSMQWRTLSISWLMRVTDPSKSITI
jgi:hypothetical protein